MTDDLDNHVLAATPPTPRVLRLDAHDNVVIVVNAITAGEQFELDDELVSATESLPLGFKIAASDLAEHTVVRRLAMPIGRTTKAVAKGQLVHTHNMDSLYSRTHERGEE